VLKVEQENAALLASVHEEANELTWRVTFLEGELEYVCQTRDMAEMNFQGLSAEVAGANRRWEDVERQC
jgi:hypothetical protein